MEKEAVTRDRKEIIRAEGLTLGYDGEAVVENLDLSILEGEVLGILGPSGCGKSTILKALAGLLPVMKGRILVAGEEITDSDLDALVRARQHMGVLFQSGALIASASVGDNIALPLRESTELPEEIIRQVVQIKLEMVELPGTEHLMPSELSGGMKKRAGLARSIALDPEILLCDEPSSGLDPATALEIDQLLLELKKVRGMTIVVVTHDVASVENLSDRCILLDCEAKGIIAEGTVEELEKESTDPRVQSFFRRRVEKSQAGREKQ